MRILKRKIQRALQAQNPKDSLSTQPTEPDPKPITSNLQSLEVSCKLASPQSNQASYNQKPKKYIRSRDPKQKKSQRIPSSTKNMAINFGKAISSFSTSLLALPYLEPQLQKYELAYADFVNFVMNSKETIASIETFRNMLVPRENDNPKVAKYKIMFKYLSEIFIKYFSVNWIIHGKVAHKLVYLKYRFKMLRRIQNPESFTYVTKRGEYKKAKKKLAE